VNSRLLCDPTDKARLENANADEQLAYIHYLVSDYGVTQVRESHVRELHRLAIQGIYGCAGEYRKATKRIRIRGSCHRVPEPARVEHYVIEALDYVNGNPPPGILGKRGQWAAFERAAYALWRFNWIHPFAGGNGRVSRAIAYLLICIEHGEMLPGSDTVPAIINRKRKRYYKALRLADRALRLRGYPDFHNMCRFIEKAVRLQFASVGQR
jgi:fido (protein-threonine AMPylation protein)